MTVTNVFILMQKDGGERTATATKLVMSDRDAGIIAAALDRCPGLIPGEICSILGGAFSQLQAVVAKAEPVTPLNMEERTVNADRVVSPPPAGVKLDHTTQQAEDPMKDVRKAAEDGPVDGIRETAAGKPVDEPTTDTKSSDKRKR